MTTLPEAIKKLSDTDLEKKLLEYQKGPFTIDKLMEMDVYLEEKARREYQKINNINGIDVNL